MIKKNRHNHKFCTQKTEYMQIEMFILYIQIKIQPIKNKLWLFEVLNENDYGPAKASV